MWYSNDDAIREEVDYRLAHLRAAAAADRLAARASGVEQERGGWLRQAWRLVGRARRA